MKPPKLFPFEHCSLQNVPALSHKVVVLSPHGKPTEVGWSLSAGHKAHFTPTVTTTAAKEQAVACVWVCVHLLNLFRAQLEARRGKNFFLVLFGQGGAFRASFRHYLLLCGSCHFCWWRFEAVGDEFGPTSLSLFPSKMMMMQRI